MATRLTDNQRLSRLKHELNYAGHRAYSLDNLETNTAVKAFERVDKLKERIKVLEKSIADKAVAAAIAAVPVSLAKRYAEKPIDPSYYGTVTIKDALAAQDPSKKDG